MMKGNDVKKICVGCLMLLGCVLAACGSSAPTTMTTDSGVTVHIYNPNVAYGPAPSYIAAWIPSDCTDQGTVFDASGANEIRGTLPWVPVFQAAMGVPQDNGLGVQTLRCGKAWRFLGWNVDSSHSYHELSAPGRTDCPNGLVRFTRAPLLLHDPYGVPFVASLEERGSGNDWVASQVSMVQTVTGQDLYPPDCPPA